MNQNKQQFYSQLLDLSLNMRIELPYEKILEIASVGEYNNFNVQRLTLFLDKIDSLIPATYYNENNPNNGRRLYTLSIGREGSIVVYLNLVNYGFTEGSQEAIRIIKEKARDLKKFAEEKALVDEFSIDYNPSQYGETLEMRLWWD